MRIIEENMQSVFYNFDKSLPEYEIGDKVCQLKVGFTPIIKFTETKDLTITDEVLADLAAQENNISKY